MTQSTSLPPDRVIVFARFPEAGQVKTRLIPSLGPERAAQLQAALTRRTLDVAQRLCSARLCTLEVRYTGGDIPRMRNLFGAENRYSAQQGTCLGERLEHAVCTAFMEGSQRVLVIGTDCPELEPTILDEAFEALSRADIVLGPAIDGGYYLIGMRANQPKLFRGIDWGTQNVLLQTVKIARRAQLSVRQLRQLSDVDNAEDLLACRRVPEAFCDFLPQIRAGVLSIVVPTFNEERTIEHTLEAIVGLPDVEVIIADGGSTDATAEIARRMGVCVVPVRPGRGRQMNAGAALASGEVLLFLHSDTTLPGGFRKHVWSTLDRGAVAGAFPLCIDEENSGLRWIEWGANLRSRYRQMPYGDQGLFIRAKDFLNVGGFQNWPLMEDYEFCRRVRRVGRIGLASAAATTSGRRWQKLGVLQTTLINQLCIALFRMGISPERIAKYYYGK